METINAIDLSSFPGGNLRKVSDLIYYQGPLLSHYINEYGDNYLFIWVDNDDRFNRWLFVRISFNTLQDYLNRKISLLELLQSPGDGFLYKVDIDEELNYENVQILTFGNIPSAYRPSPQSFYKFEPSDSEAILNEILDISNNGILQATFKNSSKVGYGTIHLNVFSPVIHHIEEITTGLGLSYFKLKQKHQVSDVNGKNPKLNKTEFLSNTQFEIAGMIPGSFKLLLKPVNTQRAIVGEKSETDNYCNYLLGFIEASYSYERLLEYTDWIDAQVITHYEKLLKNIKANKLDFRLKWSNKESNLEMEEGIDFKKASIILENISRLEYHHTEDLKVVGRFLEINLKTSHFTFLSEGEDSIECKGYFDNSIKEGAYMIVFNKTYEVIVKRDERKEAGHKKARVDDILMAFYEINM